MASAQRTSFEERLRKHISTTPDTNGCLLWTGNDRGVIGTGKGKGTAQADRAIYEMEHGPIPPGLCLQHECGTLLCMTVAHMSLVTRAVSTQRNSLSAAATHCPNGHPYSEENTYVGTQRLKSGRLGVRRQCRTCAREQMAESHAIKRATIPGEVCACGCGQRVTSVGRGARYLRGHQPKTKGPRGPIEDRLWPKYALPEGWTRERILAAIEAGDFMGLAESGCWLWTRATIKGYGAIGRGVGTLNLKAHRVMYELLRSPIPPGLVIDHVRCGKRACGNPWHLEVVTLTVNTMRGDAPPAVNARKTHCINGHALSGENLDIVDVRRRDGIVRPARRCKICVRASDARWRAKLAARRAHAPTS